ncbi:hypothetical protein CTAM01_05693 [Colletotrichum tamarilloi]|uniref:F-box domain-containing protein n=1 Tax=Colletotrichum tamarilloi TaxID=1209934 RepID=A0ABQ9RDA2_9PEZI|nr:uncharacterized protein CTAM01_05693 [Colletotrichum tamarilloi]KAI3540511.1 hypothetical protein CSPX01_08173 [Colletotrichum filicis]KAK1501469.1 hypothetical protein CTAM01_05693 [Colletotrichum tamarilloi]
MSGKCTSVNSSQPLAQFSLAIFTRLPPELQLEILSHCQQNDLICMSLASHSLRAMMLPLIPTKPSLLSYDQVNPPETIKCECENATSTSTPSLREDAQTGRPVDRMPPTTLCAGGSGVGTARVPRARYMQGFVGPWET